MKTNKTYLRSTRNLYFKDEDGLRIFYSYTTPVAFENFKNGYNKRFISKNVWSLTTAKHLNWIEDFWGAERKSFRANHEDFKKSLNQARAEQEEGPTDNGPDLLKTTGTISKLFGLMSGDMNKGKQLDQKKRFFEISGLTFPDDWDNLPIEEKEKRINQVENFAIDQHDLHAIKQGGNNG